MHHRIRRCVASTCLVAMLLPGLCAAALFGNTTVNTARPIMPDGIAYLDQISQANPEAWFTFRMEVQQSYSIEVWNPDGPQLTQGNLCVADLLEADGTTALAGVVQRRFDIPAPMVESGFTQGSRGALIASGATRKIAIRLRENGAAPATPHNCSLRVVTTTLASPRWSVNGYTDFIAVSNTSAATTVHVNILFFDEAGNLAGTDSFALAPNGSTQVVKANGVAIGGALKGGIRIVHDGAPGTIIAQQLLNNPVANTYLQFPFALLVHSYGRGSN